MELKKVVYVNGEFANEFLCSGDEAKNELIALLLDKAKKRYGYKIKMTTDPVYHEIRATLEYKQERSDNTTTKFVYEYKFSHIDPKIDLH